MGKTLVLIFWAAAASLRATPWATSDPGLYFDSVQTMEHVGTGVLIGGASMSGSFVYQARIERRNFPAGSLDAAFGSGGALTIAPDATHWLVTHILPVGSSFYVAISHAVTWTTETRIEKRDLLTGALAAGFGSSGVLMVSDGIGTLASDGSALFLLGSTGPSGSQASLIEKRDLSSGALVAGFGTGGRLTDDASANDDRFNGAKLAGGYLYITGVYDALSTTTGSGTQMMQKRSAADGSLATGFGIGGGLLGSQGAYGHLVIDGSSLFVASSDYGASTATSQVRIDKRDLATGAMDAVWAGGAGFLWDPTADSESALMLESDGAGGVFCSTFLTGATSSSPVIKLDASGALDPAFGTGGVYAFDPSAGFDFFPALFLDSGSIYLAGYETVAGINTQWRIEQLAAGPLPTPSATPSPTAFLSPTETPVLSPTPSATVSPSPTGTWSATDSPTITETPSASPTASPSPSFTASPTPGAGCVIFGTSTVLASSFAGIGVQWYMRHTLAAPMTLRSLNVYSGVAGGTVRAALYSNGAGNTLGSLLVQSGDVASGLGWTACGVADTALAAGDYWIAFENTGSHQLRYASNAITNSYGYLSAAYAPFQTSPAGVLYGSFSISAFASDCAAPVLSPTVTQTLTPSFSVSPTWTPSRTVTVTSTISPSFSVSPTQSPTRTATLSHSITPTYSTSPTLSPSPTPVPALPFPWADSLETGAGDWSANGLWHLVDTGSSNAYALAYSPAHAFYYGQDSSGNYDTGLANSGTLAGPVVAVPGGGGTLSFRSWYQTEGSSTTWDQRWVQASVNGGAFFSLQQLSGDAMSTWLPVSISLNAYAGSTVQIRFYFTTIDSGANAYRGWYVDDVAISSPPTPTPSATLTASRTVTLTFSSSPTYSVSPTRTPSPSASMTHTASPIVSITPTPTPFATDAYEVDNLYTQAKAIVPGDTVGQWHNAHSSCDQDWVVFAAVAGQAYTIETFNLNPSADTTLNLYGTDGTTSIAFDDDSGVGLASLISWTCPSSGNYYVKQQHYSCAYGPGSDYWLRVTGPAVTPTHTRTLTRTCTLSPTPTSTQTLTVTLTPTDSATPSSTVTPTSTLSPTFSMSPTVTESPTVTPTVALAAAKAGKVFSYPNPFIPGAGRRCTIIFEPVASAALQVWDWSGRRRGELDPARVNAAAGYAVWDGLLDGGETAAPGLYFLLLKTPGGDKTAKLTVVWP